MRISCLCATFVAGVLWLGVDFISAQQQPPAPTGAPAPTARASGHVAVIDIGYIFRHHDRFKDALDRIKIEFEEYEKSVRDQQQVMAAKAEQLKSLPAGSPEYRALEEELAGMNTKLRLELGRKQKDRVDREAKVYFNAYKEIEFHVQRFAERYGIELVVRFNSEEMDPNKPESVLQGINRFIVYNNQLDISNHILTELKAQTPPMQRTGAAPAPPIPPRSGATR